MFNNYTIILLSLSYNIRVRQYSTSTPQSLHLSYWLLFTCYVRTSASFYVTSVTSSLSACRPGDLAFLSLYLWST